MQNDTTKRVIRWGLVILWMALIFSMSAQTGDESSGFSDKIVGICVDIFRGVFPKSEYSTVYTVTNVLVRKGAHFTEYAILAVLCYRAVSVDLKAEKAMIIVIVICFLYAGSDELHQYFVGGRGARFSDVLIDTVGGITGTAIAYGFTKRSEKKNAKRETKVQNVP